MTDTVINAEVAPLASTSPAIKKVKTAVPIVKKPRIKPAHPPTAEMVYNAIRILKERSGSSLQAIKKYVSSTYKIDAEKLAPFIKKYLRNAVASGQLVQTKGKGASGSFKLANREPAQKKKKELKPKVPKAKSVKSTASEKKTKSAAKATDAKKKPAVAKAKSSVKKVAASAEKKKPAGVKSAKAKLVAKATKSPKQKPTKATKVVAKKPKTPKPKKVAPSKTAAAAPKKATITKKK